VAFLERLGGKWRSDQWQPPIPSCRLEKRSPLIHLKKATMVELEHFVSCVSGHFYRGLMTVELCDKVALEQCLESDFIENE
jgi:hypothetical protein